MTGTYDQLANSLQANDRHTSRVAILSTSYKDVSIVYENSRFGTDFGSLSQISKSFGCNAIKVIDNGVWRKSLVSMNFQPTAGWEHVNEKAGIRRAIQVFLQDGRWRYEELGIIRDYEDPENSHARKKSARINGRVIAMNLARMGIPVINENLMPNWDELSWVRVRAG